MLATAALLGVAFAGLRQPTEEAPPGARERRLSGSGATTSVQSRSLSTRSYGAASRASRASIRSAHVRMCAHCRAREGRGEWCKGAAVQRRCDGGGPSREVPVQMCKGAEV